jgi:hypothetical protein
MADFPKSLQTFLSRWMAALIFRRRKSWDAIHGTSSGGNEHFWNHAAQDGFGMMASQPSFFSGKLAEETRRTRSGGLIFPTLPMRPAWQGGFSAAHRAGILFSAAG